MLLAANIALCCWLTVIQADPWLVDVGFYVNIILMAALLMRLKQGDVVLRLSPRLDKRIGDFSYPIYLLHWQCGLLAAYLICGSVPEPLTTDSLQVLTGALVVVVVVSQFIIWWVDGPLHRLRSNYPNPAVTCSNNEALR